MTTFTPRAQRNRKTYNRRRIFLALGLLVTALVVWAGARFYQFWTNPLTGSPVDGEEEVAATPADKNHFTVLLVGADQRPNDVGRSDTMLLAFVDLEKGAVKLLSFPRDSYVEIPGHGWDKINASYALGGTKLVQQTYPDLDGVPVEKINSTYATGGARLVKKTVETLAGVPVDYWVTVDMSGFAEIVDAVGGIDVVIDHDLDYEDPWDEPPLYIHLKAGAQRLEGIDALHYVRFRHDAQSDWGRMARQQQAIKALVQAALRPANLTRIPQLVKLGLANVHTNMSPSQASGLANVAKKTFSGDSISSVSLTGEDLWAPDNSKDPDSIETYYTVLDFAKMRETVREMAGIPRDAAVVERDRKDAIAYEKAIPFGSADSGGWRQELVGSDVAKGDKTKPTDDDKPPPTDGGQTPPGDGGQTPPGDGGQTPPGDGGQTTPSDGSQTPPSDGGQTPPSDGGQTPPSDGGQTPPSDGGQTPPRDGAQGAG
ncbi:MAG TPA: LCP family protein [Symbiobacteriaceae bacterium]|nr:LCP family protein [Symbiobacteriaceae bacterium]